MKVNLFPQLEWEQKQFIEKLKRSEIDFVQEDTNMLREANDKFVVYFNFKMLYYSEKGCGIMRTLWHRIVVYSDEDASRILLDLLKHLNLAGFHDEDAHGGGIFTGKEAPITSKTDFRRNFAYCYINPDYPKGYWENHTLEVKPEI